MGSGRSAGCDDPPQAVSRTSAEQAPARALATMGLVSAAMADEGRPIAWMALENGTPVIAGDGEEVGKVADVVADESKDIFSGVVFRTGLLEAKKFVPATDVDEITSTSVRLRISSKESGSLENYEG